MKKKKDTRIENLKKGKAIFIYQLYFILIYNKYKKKNFLYLI